MQWLFTSLFVLVPLIWLPWTSELFEFNKLMLTYVIAILIGCAWSIRCILEKRIIFKRTILDIPLLIFLGFSILSLVFSIDPHTSWYGYYSRWNGGVLSLLVYSFLYWAYVSNMDSKSTKSTIFYSLISATLISIYASLEHFGYSISCLLVTGNFNVACWVQDVQNRVYATMGQPNWLAAYIVSLIFLPLSNLLNLKFEIRNLKSIFNFLIFILLFCTLLFTKSRSGLLAFGISSIVFWGISFSKKMLLSMIIFAFSVLSLLFVFQNPIRDLFIKNNQESIIKNQGTSLESGGTESGAIRKIVWTGATRIWLSSIKNFLVGSGPETFAQAYYQYRPIEHNQTSEWELLYNKAHNEFLNQLATTGFIGLLSYLSLLIVMSIIFLKTIYDHRMPTNDNRMTIALFAGWLTILVTNFWGFSVVVTQLLLFLLPAISIVLSTQKEEKKTDSYKVIPLQILGVMITLSTSLWLLFSVGKYWSADIKYASGSNALKGYQITQDPQYLVTAYQGYYDAFQSNPGEPTLASDLSLSAAYLALAMRNEPATAGQLASQSLSLSQLAILVSPKHPNYYKNLTRSLILLSELDDSYLDTAKKTMLAAANISPTDPRIPYYLGIILQAQGATPEAKLYFQKSLDLKPDFSEAKKQLQ